jgi:asparagine synthase (glutamine-hydrolysing)
VANFAALIDPDRARRERFLEAARPQLAPLPDLEAGSAASGDCAVLWARAAHAPTDALAKDGAVAVAWGDVAGAAEILDAWRAGAARPRDGYHAALAWDPRLGLRVSADPLGLFPLVYAARGEVCLVASSPAAFRHHPAFPPALDPAGLVGVLLTNGLFDGRTPMRGVRRLAAAHALYWDPCRGAREQREFELSFETSDAPLPDEVERVHAHLEAAFARSVRPGLGHVLTLSGGRDSRLVGSHALRRGAPLVALTFGEPRDVEMRCARRVARALGVAHHTRPDDPEHWPAYLARQAALDCGSNAFALPFLWGHVPRLAQLAPRSLSGATVDALLGGSPTGWAGGVARHSSERFLHHVFRWGVPARRLRALLRREVFGDAVDEVVERVRRTYRDCAPTPHQRDRIFYWTHRLRFQAGSIPWIDSFGSWPVLPLDERASLGVALSLAPAVCESRRLESELLLRHHLRLARIPLDRNSYVATPLRPGWIWALERARWRRPPRTRGERRRYYRIFDANHASWRGVRRALEPCRHAADDLFHPEVLAELLPPPDQDVRTSGDVIADTNGARILLGFLLWARDWR